MEDKGLNKEVCSWRVVKWDSHFLPLEWAASWTVPSSAWNSQSFDLIILTPGTRTGRCGRPGGAWEHWPHFQWVWWAASPFYPHMPSHTMVSAVCERGCVLKPPTPVLFFLIYLLIMLLQLSHFCPFTQLHPAHPFPPTVPPYSSCPWVILISSLASTFPTLFLPSLSIFHLSFMLFILCTSPHLPIPYW